MLADRTRYFRTSASTRIVLSDDARMMSFSMAVPLGNKQLAILAEERLIPVLYWAELHPYASRRNCCDDMNVVELILMLTFSTGMRLLLLELTPDGELPPMASLTGHSMIR